MFRIKFLPTISILLSASLSSHVSATMPAIMVSRMDERVVDVNPPKVADDNSVIVTTPTASPPTASSPTMVSPNGTSPSGSPISGAAPTNAIPIPDVCFDNNDGSFGNSNDGNGYEVYYLYEMVTLPGSDVLNALASLEAVISNALLSSSLLPCNRRKNFIRKRRAQTSSIIGISSFPSDSVTGDECVVADGTPCDVIEGIMTVYLSENDTSVKDSILNVIKTGMTDGSFASSVQDIEELVYIDPNDVITDDGTNNVQGPGATNTGKAANGGLSTIPLIASGVAALILLGVIAGRRASNKNREFDELEDDNQNQERDETDETLENTQYAVGSDSYLDQTGGSVTVTSCCDVMNTPY